MRYPKYRDNLPQLGESRLLTDGGLETTLIYHDAFELPYFAAFDILRRADGRRALTAYYLSYVKIARQYDLGFVLDSATWRASRDWGDRLGYDDRALEAANRDAVELLFWIRDTNEGAQPFVVSGNIGPRGDGYSPAATMDAEEAEAYHAEQVRTLDRAGVDMISAITMTHVGEALGIARAAARRRVPLALSFTVETDGRLPTGQPLGEAIEQIDAESESAPAYYMINCAHPDHFLGTVSSGAPWTRRIGGLRANASRLSHAELDAAQELDDGDPQEFGRDHAELMRRLPNLRVFGGCCGTDHRHVGCIADKLSPARAA